MSHLRQQSQQIISQLQLENIYKQQALNNFNLPDLQDQQIRQFKKNASKIIKQSKIEKTIYNKLRKQVLQRSKEGIDDLLNLCIDPKSQTIEKEECDDQTEYDELFLKFYKVNNNEVNINMRKLFQIWIKEKKSENRQKLVSSQSQSRISNDYIGTMRQHSRFYESFYHINKGNDVFREEFLHGKITHASREQKNKEKKISNLANIISGKEDKHDTFSFKQKFKEMNQLASRQKTLRTEYLSKRKTQSVSMTDRRDQNLKKIQQAQELTYSEIAQIKRVQEGQKDMQNNKYNNYYLKSVFNTKHNDNSSQSNYEIGMPITTIDSSLPVQSQSQEKQHINYVKFKRLNKLKSLSSLYSRLINTDQSQNGQVKIPISQS